MTDPTPAPSLLTLRLPRHADLVRLADAIRYARTPGNAIHGAVRGLVGCPVPDRWEPFPAWTSRRGVRGVMRFELRLKQLRGCLPPHADRDYSIADLVAAVLVPDKAGRCYVWPGE